MQHPSCGTNEQREGAQPPTSSSPG
jgi:hypothetical protein